MSTIVILGAFAYIAVVVSLMVTPDASFTRENNKPAWDPLLLEAGVIWHDSRSHTYLRLSAPQKRIIWFLMTLLFLISGCRVNSPSLPVETSIASTTPLLETPIPEVQGHLTFSYLSADAGNFSLQAGEEILITWEDAPTDAAQHEIRFVHYDGSVDQIFTEMADSLKGIHAMWHVPRRVTGQLEGIASFPDGSIVRAQCCAQIFSGDILPEGICSLSVVGVGIQNVYEHPSEESIRQAGIAPGKYVEVLKCISDEWYFVNLERTTERFAEESSTNKGWMKGKDNVRLHGPCRDVPFVDE